jgi:acyl carrier protein
MTSGMLDSFAVLNVVTFLEDQFGISIKPREAVIKNLSTISDIARLVTSKRASPAIG